MNSQPPPTKLGINVTSSMPPSGPFSAPPTSPMRLPPRSNIPTRAVTLDSPSEPDFSVDRESGSYLAYRPHPNNRRPSADDLAPPSDSRPSTPSSRSLGLSSRSDDSHTRTGGSSVASHTSASSTTTGTTPLVILPCSACQVPMSGQFVRALNTVFHLECFRCKDCDSVVASKFFPIEGPDGKQHPLCERDYFRRLNLICGKCDNALRGSYITACNKKFHVEHFTCSVCPTLFGPSDSYYEHDNDVYCHYHYSTRFATKCAGCNSAILKQFVEINRNMRDECWHPECYMINKFWNVKVMVRRPSSLLETNSQETLTDTPYVAEEQKETPTSLKERQQRMEQLVYRIWTVLSAFEESSAACISEMLRDVSNGQYLEAIRMAEKFILHVEVLFATIDDLEYHFLSIKVKGMSHVREARMLCRKTVDLFTLLSHTQETAGARRMGMTQELLALVTGLAHYLKILIRIALTGALKLDREHVVRDALPSFLDKLHRLAKENGNPAVPRLLAENVRTGHGVTGTQGVAFGYRSLAPEFAGDSPFWPPTPNSSNPATTAPPSDLCLGCNLTVEEDCVRLGTYQRWHSHCVKCQGKDCGRTAAPPVRPTLVTENSAPTGDEKESKPSTPRRPPAAVDDFVYEQPGRENTSANGNIPPPEAIFCKDHARSGSRKGFESVSRLEQYAFLLNVALRRLHLLLKKRGVMPSTAPPSSTSPASGNVNADGQRNSASIIRVGSVHLDRKLSTTARLPKRSTIVESPSGKIAQPTNVQHSQISQTSRGQTSLGQGPPSQGHEQVTTARSPRLPNTAAQHSQQPQPNTPRQPPPSQRLQMPPPGMNLDAGPTSPNAGQHVTRPPFARENTQVYIVDENPPETPGDEQRYSTLTNGEEGITLADIPQLMEAEQAREQQRSLPRHGKPLIAELSALELAVIKHAALLALTRSPLRDQFDLDDILELVEMKKGGFWNKLFKGGNEKKMKKKGVFGVPLELLVEREGSDSLLGASRSPLHVPSFIDDAISAMKQMDMSIEGIFRKNGNIRRLKDLTDAIDRDPASVDLSQDNPVQLAALLKKFLRELPDPLLTYKLHRLFVATQSQPHEADRKRLLHLVSLLLPKSHRDTMEVLFVFLKWVASFSHVDEETGSKMDLPNLATVICPSILYSKSRDPARDESFLAIRVVTQLLEEQDDFYTVPDEFLSLLDDQDYFLGCMELTSKDFLKKVDSYMRLKQTGRGPIGTSSPIMGGIPSGGVGSNGAPRPEDSRLLPHRSEPNMSRGRAPPPPDASRTANRSQQKRDSQSLERPSNSDSNGQQTSPPKHPGLSRQQLSHPGPAQGATSAIQDPEATQNFASAGNSSSGNHQGPATTQSLPSHLGSPRMQPVQQPSSKSYEQQWPGSPRTIPSQRETGQRQPQSRPGSRPTSFVRSDITQYQPPPSPASLPHGPINGRQSPYQPRNT